MGDNGRAMATEPSEPMGTAGDAALVARVRDGETDAYGALYDRWFDRVHDVAFRVTHDSSTAADVAQDAFLAAWQQLPRLENPEVFGGWLLRITRNRALDHVRRGARSTPGDPETMAMIEQRAASSAGGPAGFRVEDRLATADDPTRAAEDDELAALVWGAAEALGERDAEVLDLTLRQGMTPVEIAQVVGTNRNAANQMVHRTRARLGDAVRARVLWRRGQPECGDLADALADAGIDRFGADAVRVTTAHADGCAVCSERRQLRLDPAHLFAAIPVVGAPVLVKQRVAHALMADGVPVQRSAALAAPPDAPGSSGTGTGTGTGGGDGDGDGGGDGGRDGGPVETRRSASRARRVAVGVATVIGVLVVALGAVVAVAERLDHGTVDERVAAPRVPSTTAVPSTTVAPATTAVPEEPTPAATTLPRVPDVTIPPAPAPVTVTLVVAPSSRPAFQNYTKNQAPMLTWDSANPTTITISGSGVQASGVAGSVPVCPTGFTTFDECTAPHGTHEYVATARDASGAVVATATAVLTFT